MQDEKELDFYDLFTVDTDEEIKNLVENRPTYEELQQKVKELEQELNKLKEQEEKRYRQTEKARQKRKETSKSEETYHFIQEMVRNGYKRRNIVGLEYKRRDGTIIKITDKMYANAIYKKEEK